MEKEILKYLPMLLSVVFLFAPKPKFRKLGDMIGDKLEAVATEKARHMAGEMVMSFAQGLIDETDVGGDKELTHNSDIKLRAAQLIASGK